MKSYTELTESQQKDAFNYHLNSLIPAFPTLVPCPPDAPWSLLDEVAAALAPLALARAKTSLYSDDTKKSILPIIQQTISPSALDNTKSCL